VNCNVLSEVLALSAKMRSLRHICLLILHEGTLAHYCDTFVAAVNVVSRSTFCHLDTHKQTSPGVDGSRDITARC